MVAITMISKTLCLCFLLVHCAVGLQDDQQVVADEQPEIRLDIKEFNKYLNRQDKAPLLSKFTTALENNETEEQVAIINDWVDECLINMNLYIINNGYDPVEIEGFESTIGWGIFKGWVIFDRGQLKGLSTFKRQGDVKVIYKYPNLEADVSLGFDLLEFQYRYKIKIMYIGPSGRAVGKSQGNKFTLNLGLNMISAHAHLNKFTLDTLGSLSIKLKGNVLSDWLYNTVIWTVKPLIRSIISTKVEAYVIDFFTGVLETYNTGVCNVLGSCL